MTRQRMVDMYSEYYGVTKKLARQRVGLILKSETPEKSARYFQALEESLKSEAHKAFYED